MCWALDRRKGRIRVGNSTREREDLGSGGEETKSTAISLRIREKGRLYHEPTPSVGNKLAGTC